MNRERQVNCAGFSWPGGTPAPQYVRLTRDNAKHIVLRKEKVEIGNLAEHVSNESGRRMSLDVQEARKRDE
jgi:hypothetical protein